MIPGVHGKKQSTSPEIGTHSYGDGLPALMQGRELPA